MKKNKKKILLIILAIVLIIIILLAIHTIRNFTIIKELQKNIEPYVSSTNYHIKSVATEESGTIVTINYYKKDGKEVMIMERNLNGEISKISTYVTDKRTDTFYETKDSKTIELDSEAMLSINVYNSLETENDWQTFFGSILTSVKKTDYNGKECYIVNNFLSPQFLGGSTNDEVYVEKDTGLCVKATMNGTVTEREYEFNNVSDEIFIEPNIGEYDIRE